MHGTNLKLSALTTKIELLTVWYVSVFKLENVYRKAPVPRKSSLLYGMEWNETEALSLKWKIQISFKSITIIPHPAASHTQFTK